MLSSKKLTIILLILVIAALIINIRLNTSKIKVEYYTPDSVLIGRAFKNIRIAHISDLHTRNFGQIEKQLVKKLRAIKPDLIFITGDFINTDNDIPACSTLTAQLTKIAPIIATLGNNDHKTGRNNNDTPRLTGALTSLGVMLLVNESALFSHDGDSVYIVGLDDDLLLYDNYFTAISGIPANAPRILLAHTPEIANKISPAEITYIFCGHTHGGQIILPLAGNLFNYFKFKHLKGLHDVENSPAKIYVNRGIGTSFLPIRWGSRPEIALFEFK